MRILSGIQPSGQLHLGNYFGMMRRMISYQHDHDLYCFIVNYHALTSQRDGAELRAKTLEAAADFLALGLDPDRCTFWVQSDVPQVTELAWILSNITGMGLLERCHSYKDKVAQGLVPSHGLFAYPVLMAADILMLQADRIPVGQDQKQHLEVAQDIAEKFNHAYGTIFRVPEPDILKETGLLPGVDGRKMSKSYQNTIDIFCTREALQKKVMSIKTDSRPIGEAKDPSEMPLYAIYAAFLDEPARAALKERFLSPGLRYSDVKQELGELIWRHFEPFRAKREELMASPERLTKILAQGAEKARAASQPTFEAVRRAVGLHYQEA
ncbi:MAG: tryptophan--tRNA ligase [Candidatus Omnitrophica bacterium]|nr:tryptophan--tRNA ligase [Candidatus Omnitrophota bacterium]